MSHRSALVVSIALTLVLALGIFAGRDRLFEGSADAGPSTVTSATSPADTVNGSEQPAVSTAPRVIEIPLPTEQRSTLRQADESQKALGREGNHERDEYDADEHEGEDDD
jgi:hypothetical protein